MNHKGWAAMLRAREKTRGQAEQDRRAVVQVVLWCIVIAMHEVLGYGAKRLNEFGRQYNIAIDKYETMVRAVGEDKAKRWIAEETGGLRFVLPADRAIRRQKDRERLAQKRMAADQAWTLAVVAWKDMGIGEKRAQAILDKAEEEYRWFLDWAKEGDEYGYERIRQAAEAILHEEMEVVEEPGDKPVFSDVMR